MKIKQVEMEKIPIYILGLTASTESANTFALILKEEGGRRRLPIIIGGFEAQAIALELEGYVPPRPMTHDLLKTSLETFGAVLSEIVINDLRDGTFYAKLVFEDNNIELDARPSDAIALAVRCGVPIYINSDVLDEAGVIPPVEDVAEQTGNEPDYIKKQKQAYEKKGQPKSRMEHLQSQLDNAIKNEDYEKAAEIRDEMKKIIEST